MNLKRADTKLKKTQKQLNEVTEYFNKLQIETNEIIRKKDK
jgi:Asp-tRNA(Asn)/Glu-tRNA(Gln) amidotransferase C subunit